jgi:hypothetical protein
MKMHTDENGNPVPALAIGAKGFYVSSTDTSAKSNALNAGFYRISAASAVADGLNYYVGPDTEETPIEAEATDAYLAVGAIETIFVPNGYKIAVLGGDLSVIALA